MRQGDETQLDVGHGLVDSREYGPEEHEEAQQSSHDGSDDDQADQVLEELEGVAFVVVLVDLVVEGVADVGSSVLAEEDLGADIVPEVLDELVLVFGPDGQVGAETDGEGEQLDDDDDEGAAKDELEHEDDEVDHHDQHEEVGHVELEGDFEADHVAEVVADDQGVREQCVDRPVVHQVRPVDAAPDSLVVLLSSQFELAGKGQHAEADIL